MSKPHDLTMDTIYEKIYEKAEPYWATRKNDVHIPSSYDYARRLLISYPSADEDIVLPAVLLHDVGWIMVPEEKQRAAFGPTVKDKKSQRLHETEGVRISEEILISVGYDKGKIREILSIVDGHDTRMEALSLNDKLVKDADKLWRFTPEGVRIDHDRFGIDLEQHVNWLSDRIEDWFWTPEAKEMARETLQQARRELLPSAQAASYGLQVRKP